MEQNDSTQLVYVFPVVALAAVLLYYVYGAIDRLGLEVQHAEGRVTGKQVAAGSTTYNTNYIDGRAVVTGTKNPEMYVVAVDVNGEPAGGAVTREVYDSLQQGDVVQVRFRRTRFSQRLLVTDVRP